MKLSQRYILLLLAALVLGIYYPALFAPLCLTDDYKLILFITDNKFTWKGIFLPGDISYYRPLFTLSLWVEQILWMCEESFMHLDNILIHLANVILIYFVALKAQTVLYKQKNVMAACAAAAVFAVHPLCSESILWIPARVDPMAAFFIYLALLFLMVSLEKQSRGLIFLSMLSLVIGALAKESAFFLPPAFLFTSFSYWRVKHCVVQGSDTDKPLSLIKILHSLGIRLTQVFSWLMMNKFIIFMYSIVPVIYFVIRRMASFTRDHGTLATYSRISKHIDKSAWDPFFLSLKGLGFYLKKIFIPWPLNFTIVEVSDWYTLFGVLFILMIIYLLWRADLIASFFIIAIVAVIPAIIVLIAGIGWTPYAERYLYISVAPLVIGFMLILQSLQKIERYRVLIPVAIVAIFALTTVNRNILWTDSLAFYKDCVNKAPNFYPGLRNYAAALAREGLQKEASEFRRNNVPVKQNGELFYSKESSSSTK